MTSYEVKVTDSALTAITCQARYVAPDRQEPIAAQRWLEQVWDAVDSLEQWPIRAVKAKENYYVAYELRQLVVGKHLLLFRVDEARRFVWIVGLRHGSRRTSAKDNDRP